VNIRLVAACSDRCLSCVQANLLLFRFFMGYCFIIVSSIVSLDCMVDLDYLRVGGSSSLLYASCVLCSAKVFIRR
jgi:hypothetical protein